MTNQELEQAIRDIINDIYCAEYCARLRVEQNNYCNIHSYKVTFGLNNNDKPLIISYQGNDADFLTFIREDLRKRYLHYTEYFMGYQLPPNPIKNGEEQECENSR